MRYLSAALIVTIAVIGTAMSGELVGSKWRPSQIGLSRMPSDTNLFVQFKGNGQLAGHGGCNRFFGSYRVAGSTVKIGLIGATRMACPEPIMDLERKFFIALEAVETFERYGPELVLRDGKGAELTRFQQAESD